MMRIPVRPSNPESTARPALLMTSLMATAGFLALSIAVQKRATYAVDRKLRRKFHPRSRRAVTRAAELATDAASPHVHPIVALVLAAIATRATGRVAYAIPLASICATVVDKSTRMVIHQERPPRAGTHHGLDRYAFPSGHTCAITAISLATAFTLWPTLSLAQRGSIASAGAVAALGIGWTRLYLDEHWIDDILGGLLAGVAVGSGAVALTSL